MPVNVVAPYVLIALLHRTQRLVYLSSSTHRGGRASLTRMDWSGHRTTGSYSDSKLFVTTLAIAVARTWTDVLSKAVNPGWVPTTAAREVRPPKSRPTPTERAASGTTATRRTPRTAAPRLSLHPADHECWTRHQPTGGGVGIAQVPRRACSHGAGTYVAELAAHSGPLGVACTPCDPLR
jgi:NAD(P)-dependent dehydrogenase (short-subunit alcohol dehydrogenase family)